MTLNEKFDVVIDLLNSIDNELNNEIFVPILTTEDGLDITEYSCAGLAEMIEKAKDNIKVIPHIHCPVNGWDCPYYTDKGHPCRCTLEDPYADCDDFATMWDVTDDWIDYDWRKI